MRLVLDTNVIVSASLGPGSPPDQLFRSWRANEFELVTSEPLLRELQTVISRPKIADRAGWTRNEQIELLDELRERCIVVSPEIELTAIEADPTDNRVLEAALEGQADYIVTGDRHLLDLNRYADIAIVTPRRILAILTEVST